MDEFQVNDRVTVIGKNSVGSIAYVGNTHFSDGRWLGIILEEPVGRNNGSYDGIRYFKCSKNRGIFVRPCQVKKVSSLSPQLEAPEVSSRNYYPNYLRGDCSLKPNEKYFNNEKKNILQNSVRKDIALKITHTSMPFIPTDGEIKLRCNNSEEKSKSITQIEKHLPENPFSKQDQDSLLDEEGRTLDCELRHMIFKTSIELNEVKDYVNSLDRKLKILKRSLREECSSIDKN